MANLSIWEKESFFAAQDVIIVGSGLMGLWTALELKNKNHSLRITILERNITPFGASTRNAGFACFGSPTEMIYDAENMGTDEMMEIARMRYLGIEKIKNTFTARQLELDNCGGYECINRNYKYWNALDEKIDWLNSQLKELTGLTETFVRKDGDIAKKGLRGFDAMIENSLEAGLHSGKLVSSLIQKVQAAGVGILNGIEVQAWEKSAEGVNIFTNQQIRLTGKQLLFCTNAFGNTLLPQLKITPARGQVILTSPIPGLAMRGTFHFDEGFYYWRNLGNRILLGGARNEAFDEERTTDISGSALIKNKLIEFLQTHLDPSYSYTIEDYWSGIMGFTENKKPLLTRIEDHVFAAIACNGMGVALTPVMGEKAAELMMMHF